MKGERLLSLFRSARLQGFEQADSAAQDGGDGAKRYDPEGDGQRPVCGMDGCDEGADGQRSHAVRFGHGAGEIGGEALGPAQFADIGRGDGEGGGGKPERGLARNARSSSSSGSFVMLEEYNNATNNATK